MEIIPPQPTPDLQPHKNFLARHILAEVLSLVVVIAVGVAGYYYQNYKSADTFVAPVHHAQTDPTATWQTYTDTQYGFSFRYPSGWMLVKNNNSNYLLDISLASPSHLDYLKSGYGDVDFFITGTDSTDKLEGRVCASGDNLCYSDYRTVNGNKWLIITDFGGDGEGSGANQKSIEIISGNKDYSFAKLVDLPKNEPLANLAHDNLDIDQILSTFQFMDSSSAVDTSTWKTYTNSQYGFSFKYPGNAILNNVTDRLGDILDITVFTNPDQAQLRYDGDVNVAVVTGPALDDYNKATNLCSTANTNPLYKGFPNFLISNQTTTFQGKTAYELNCRGEGEGSSDGHNLYVPATDNQHLIISIVYNSNIDSQILSTFKFTDATQTNASSLKTYNNSVYNFTFQYPGTWPLKDELSKNRTDSSITVGDDSKGDNPANWPVCYVVIKFQFTPTAIIPAPYTHNYYNTMSEGQSCNDTITKITTSFKFAQ